jgi:CheY-like chemotaxis protein
MHKPSVLLVEDHSVAREAMTKLLRYEGYEARSACNGIEAVAALTERTPDLMLLDLMLPKMNGVTLLKMMRNDSRWRALRVIVLTASVDHSQLAEVRGLGVSAIVPKVKFTLDELLHLMRSMLCAQSEPAAMTS